MYEDTPQSFITDQSEEMGSKKGTAVHCLTIFTELATRPPQGLGCIFE